jgi:hypothetical protein
MLTSARDLGAYVGMFLGAWPPHDGPETGPVRRASVREMQQIHRPRPAVVTRTANGAIQLSSGGYGFGLGISGDCNFAHIVAHSGGLPGFGSIMRWLPEYGVGIIAFGNRTYTGWGGPTTDALAMLMKTGGLVPRKVQPSPVLTARREAVSRLVMHWDDGWPTASPRSTCFWTARVIAGKRSSPSCRPKVGPCRAAAGFDVVENALRGQWTMPCDRGALRVSITLAPTMPPTVQFFEVRSVPVGDVPRPPALCPST